MFTPKAQTACSQTVWFDEFNKFKNNGTAPADTTACVWSEVPLAIFVNAQDASNCSVGLKKTFKYQVYLINLFIYNK